MKEINRPKYNYYSGREAFIDAAVRVQPENEPPFEATRKAGLLKTYRLTQGVRVLVNYDSAKKEQLIMDDEPAEIINRNTQVEK